MHYVYWRYLKDDYYVNPEIVKVHVGKWRRCTASSAECWLSFNNKNEKRLLWSLICLKQKVVHWWIHVIAFSSRNWDCCWFIFSYLLQLGLQMRMSQTISQDPLYRSRTEIVLEVTFAILVCLASVLGNVLVVYVVNKYSVMQTITNILIRNLALTDIIMATLIMPFWITNLYSGKWNLSQEWCEVSSSAQFIMALASLFIMGLIALNRYMKVVKPSLYIKFFPSKRVAWLYFGLVWAVSVLVATLPLYGWGKINFDSHFLLCSFNWKEGHFSFVILLVGLFDVTMVAIFYSYWKIYQTVKESTGNVNANVAQNGVGAPRFHRTDIDVLKTCLTVVCFFLITWFPISLCAFIIANGGYIPREVAKVAVYLLFSSSVVNPIIYGIMNPQFKQAFKKAFRCGRYGNGNEEQSHARVAAVIIYPRSN